MLRAVAFCACAYVKFKLSGTVPLEIPISKLEKNWDTICKDKRKYICLENSQISLKQRQCGLVIQSDCTWRTA